ncbi:hypothetical protein [Amycolatopsis aidingensis]|uniref:hypothetical protein n=1 Tax=Amycolatopsis aidingensis TaxID=2842453 RepID=UPI001C0AA8A1|nr:hypothetical protein [Amycolatopsis aidingensis]
MRDVVGELAPDELPLLDAVARFDDEHAVRMLVRGRNRREPLGFGVDEIAVLLSPVVWAALDEAVRHIVGSAVDGVAGRAKRGLRRLLRRPSAPAVLPRMTAEQIDHVCSRVRELAAEQGLDPDETTRLANAVAARLVAGDDDGGSRQ